MIANVPNHPAPMYVSSPVYTVPAKLCKATIYLPSRIAAKVIEGLTVRRSDGQTVPASGRRD